MEDLCLHMMAYLSMLSSNKELSLALDIEQQESSSICFQSSDSSLAVADIHFASALL